MNWKSALKKATFFFKKNYQRNTTRLVFLLFLILGCLIPAYYRHIGHMPPESAMQVSRGKISFRYIYKKGYLLELDGVGIPCADDLNGKYECLSSMEKIKAIDGAIGNVTWYEKKLYPFYSQRRLIRLVVEGNEIIPIEKTKSDMEWSASHAKRSVMIAAFLFGFVLLIIEWVIWGKIKNERERLQANDKCS